MAEYYRNHPVVLHSPAGDKVLLATVATTASDGVFDLHMKVMWARPGESEDELRTRFTREQLLPLCESVEQGRMGA